MNFKALTALSLTLAMTTGSFAQASQFSDFSQKIALITKVRIRQAHELLGSHYKKSVVRHGEYITDIEKFVAAQVKENLQGKYKKQSKRLARAILKESSRHHFDPIFLMAIIDHESTFNPESRGLYGEIGLMQIKPDTAEWICDKMDMKWRGKHSLFDPVTNVRIGAAYLSYLRERFNAHGRLYLAAYNMGVTNVNRALGKQIWPKDYPSKVMEHYIKFYTELRRTVKPSAPITGQSVVLASNGNDLKQQTINEITQ